MVGSLIGQYKIVGVIGTGGMGTVYAGEHTLIKRRAAIKVLKPELSQRREIVDRFFNEARAAAASEHPGVVQTFDFGFFDDGDERHAYIVMELLDGRSLASTLQDGALPELDVLRVIRQVASTIGSIHAAGIIHRDLKPDNIFLIDDPIAIGGRRVKILDFGIAKLGDAFEPSQTDAGGLFGTPLYMAPEQFDGRVDERSDIYALGCVMFEALTGRPAFPGASIAQLVRSHLIMAPPRPSSVSPALGGDVDTVVLGCLEKEPARRFPSMAALVEALDAAIARRTQGGELVAASPLAMPKLASPVPPDLADEQPQAPERPPPTQPPEAPAHPPSPYAGPPPTTPSPTAPSPVAPSPVTPSPAASSPAAPSPVAPSPAAPSPAATMVGGIAAPPAAWVASRSPTPPEGALPTLAPEEFRAPGTVERPPGTVPVGTQQIPLEVLRKTPPAPSPPRSLASTLELSPSLRFPESSAPAIPQRPATPRAAEPAAFGRFILEAPRLPGAAAGGQRESIDRARRELAEVFETAVPAGFRDAQRYLVEFFGGLFAAARQFSDQVVELNMPVIRDLEARAHYVLFLDDVDDQPAGPYGELSTQVFRARVDPLAQQLATLDTPPGSVLIAVLAAPQLGQGARETIFALRRERNLFVVPIAASEIRRACEAGNARRLLDNRIADLHTVSDPFAVFDGFTDPTRNIGFAAEVSDLVRHITGGGKVVSVAGPPGSGKTSVVAMAEYGCDTQSVSRRFVRLSCSELTSFDPETVLRELLERVDGIEAAAAGAPPTPVPLPGPPGTTNVRETIMRLGTQPMPTARGRVAATPVPPAPMRGDRPARREQLVIVLEDADWLIRLASSFEPDAGRRQRARELWRSLAELCSSAGHTVIVTSIRDFQVMDQVPLERPVSVSRVPLRALNRHESDRLVTSLGEPVGFSPTRRALARLYRESGGNVYALRLLCSHVIRAVRERPDFSPLGRLEVTPGMVDDAARHVAATGSTFRPHVSVWLDDVERIVLQHVAREQPRSPREIRRALEGSAEPAHVARALDGLELMGLVESRRGRHRVRVPLFERWIDTHLDAPARMRDAVRRTRASRIAIGCTVTALLFGAYWTWLRSTREDVESAASAGCAYVIDHPERVGAGEPFELSVYQSCERPQKHELVIEPVLSSLHIPAPTSTCTAAMASCTTTFQPVAGNQANDVYRVHLRVDGELARASNGGPLVASIEKDRFAVIRTIGEKTVPAIAFLPLLLSVALTFHKDMKRQVARLFRRTAQATATPKP